VRARIKLRKIVFMQKDAHESGDSNELGLKTIGREIKKSY